MARILNEQDYSLRRSEILDAAQRFVYSRGYEQMTIQDILTDLGISKGAFYHYFTSKQQLLEALVDRTIQEGLQVMLPIVTDDSLNALEKFSRLYDIAATWKTAQKDYLLALMKVWYTDENAIVRVKQLTASIRFITPLFGKMIQQGVDEGVFNVPDPERAGEVLLSLLQGEGDAFARLLMTYTLETNAPSDAQPLIDVNHAYSLAIERVLGVKPGALNLLDDDILKQWVTPQKTLPTPGANSRLVGSTAA
jgi:AcrR family transcriptional regulator